MRLTALAPAADQAQAIATVWQAMFWPNVAIYVAVLAALAWALWRRRAASVETPESQARHARNWTRALLGWTIFIAAVLTAYTALSFVQDRHRLAHAPGALRVRITSKQWWWSVEYLDPDPSRQVATANELHLPLGRMTRIELLSGDVIHSLWIPALNGKQDLIPGRTTELALTPRAVGRYLGQCAEFCGLQHAHMVLPVTVESPTAFATWLDAQRAPGAAPASPSAERGKQLFESGPCAMCHAIAGTSADSHAGPDLTHIASRPLLAAGALPNDRAHMAAWLSDPQAHKPGTNMPDPRLQPQEVSDLTDYLEGLR
ncbi:MAG TPA: c-type cytochrome [Xanthomonadaceae bacterium]|nr:c-type cytochrome [Xanthomonadaceae bacterium]